jgi:UDP-N-acetylglucosamine acyltransferase
MSDRPPSPPPVEEIGPHWMAQTRRGGLGARTSRGAARTVGLRYTFALAPARVLSSRIREFALSNTVHPTAIVSPHAELGSGNHIGAFAIIEDDVRLGDNNRVAAHVVVKRYTEMGNNNAVFETAVLGGDPQDLKFKNVASYLRIGNDNVFREGVSVNRGSKPDAATVLGNGNFLMCTAHIGHDCQVGNHVVMAPSAGLGGHVSVGDRAFISGGVMVHQFTHIGTLAMVGGNAKITQDVLPYMITDGNPAEVRGLNVVGLKRAGLSREDIAMLKEAYRILFTRGRLLEDALRELTAIDSAHVAQLVGFIRNAKRSFHRARD